MLGMNPRPGLGTPQVGVVTEPRRSNSSLAPGNGAEVSVNSTTTPAWGRARPEGRGFAHQGPGGALTMSPGKKSHGTLPPRPAPYLTSPLPPPLG